MTGMADDGPAMLDTNIVVYAYDPTDLAKHEAAKDLIARLSDERRLILSVQILNEFAAVMMKPRRTAPFTSGLVGLTLRRLITAAEVVPITPWMTFLALEAMARHSLSFWDSLIWAAAKENGVARIYSEDFQDGRTIEGVRIVNPFAGLSKGA